MNADYGGTDICGALKLVFYRRQTRVPTACFVLTDGEVRPMSSACFQSRSSRLVCTGVGERPPPHTEGRPERCFWPFMSDSTIAHLHVRYWCLYVHCDVSGHCPCRRRYVLDGHHKREHRGQVCHSRESQPDGTSQERHR